MKNILCLCIVFASTLMAYSVCAADDAKTLQGTWVPVKAELGGQPMPAAVLKTITLKIDKRRYKVTVSGERHSDEGTFKLDTGSKPKGITIISVKGANEGKTFPAIYELKADKLSVCYDLSGAKRPKEFKTSAGTKLYLVTYQRK